MFCYCYYYETQLLLTVCYVVIVIQLLLLLEVSNSNESSSLPVTKLIPVTSEVKSRSKVMDLENTFDIPSMSLGIVLEEVYFRKLSLFLKVS